jgi:hypothetical protein
MDSLLLRERADTAKGWGRCSGRRPAFAGWQSSSTYLLDPTIGLENGTVITQPVRTYQVAPTILSALGLNPNKLDAVRIDGVQVLPGE